MKTVSKDFDSDEIDGADEAIAKMEKKHIKKSKGYAIMHCENESYSYSVDLDLTEAEAEQEVIDYLQQSERGEHEELRVYFNGLPKPFDIKIVFK